MQCPKCSSTNYIKSGIINKKQRYKCESCSCQFTKSEKSGVPLYIKMQAVLMFISGLSMNKVAEILNVAPPTVMRWINYFKDKLGEDFPKLIKTDNKAQQTSEPIINNKANKAKLTSKLDNKDNNIPVQSNINPAQLIKAKEDLDSLLKLSFNHLSGYQLIKLDATSYMIIAKTQEDSS